MKVQNHQIYSKIQLGLLGHPYDPYLKGWLQKIMYAETV